MISNILNTIGEKINNDASLKTNTLIHNVFENLEVKMGNMSEYESMGFLKTQLSNVNSYIKNDILNESVALIEDSMSKFIKDKPSVLAHEKAFAFGLRNRVVALKDGDSYNSPSVKMLVENFTNNEGVYGSPDYYNFNGVLNT